MVAPSGIGGEKTLVGCQEPIEQDRNTPLPPMGMTRQDKVKAQLLISFYPFGAVGKQKGQALPSAP